MRVDGKIFVDLNTIIWRRKKKRMFFDWIENRHLFLKMTHIIWQNSFGLWHFRWNRLEANPICYFIQITRFFLRFIFFVAWTLQGTICLLRIQFNGAKSRHVFSSRVSLFIFSMYFETIYGHRIFFTCWTLFSFTKYKWNISKFLSASKSS